MYGSWTQVRTKKDQIDLATYGYNNVTKAVEMLYEVKIKRKTAAGTTDFWLMILGCAFGILLIVVCASVLSKKCKKTEEAAPKTE